MEQFKRAKVVMLSTNEKTNIINTNKGLLYNSNDYIGINQHLYIISDDEIKKGDWYYDNVVLQIRQWKSFMIYNKLQHKKIIATTDTSLKIDNPNYDIGKLAYITLPQPSQSFIQKYIEEYNKGNIITDVLVEYETYQYTINYHKDIWKNFEKIKINPKYNTITIKKLKTNWNREEIVEFGEKMREYCKNGYKSDSLHKVFYEWDKWVEENL